MATETTEAAHGAVEAGHSAAGTAHVGGEAVGMPQLDFSTFPNQIFWLIVTLLVIYYVLSRIALPRIAAVLAERQGTISNDLATAEELKQKAVEAEAAYDKALAEARAAAQAIAAETKDRIKADLAEATKAADAEIAEKTAGSEARIAEIRDGALANVEVVAKDTAASIVEMLDVGADAAAVDAAVKARLNGGAA